MRNIADLKVGKITHYFDKIGVAVVELADSLSFGDLIKISGNQGEFEQKVASMQVEHQQVQLAQKGQAVGLKVDQKVYPGDIVLRAQS